MHWASKHHGPRQGLESIVKRDWSTETLGREGGEEGSYFLAALKEHLLTKNQNFKGTGVNVLQQKGFNLTLVSRDALDSLPAGPAGLQFQHLCSLWIA